ncbi:MAG: sugar phosphate isomerase/epimerase family protein [Pirellulales bacterium]
MMHLARFHTASLLFMLLQIAPAWAAEPTWPPTFYAMDTAFRRPGLSVDQQLDLVKELGYPGIAWHEEKPEQIEALLTKLETRGLKMFTIYCPTKITPNGDLTYSPTLTKLMRTLRGNGTIIWLHFGGKGPDIDSLTGREPAVHKLRALADLAEANDLQIAIYPHLGEWTAGFRNATHLAQVVDHDHFGVTFNLCHSLAGGEEAEIPTLLDQAKDVLVNVTICGADGGVTGGKWGRLIQTLDKGTFDLVPLLRKLKQIGFTGPIGFQGYGIQDDARSILTPTIRAWHKLSAASDD